MTFFVKEEHPLLDVSNHLRFYVEVFDIMITMLLVYVMAKWFKMPLIYKLLLRKNDGSEIETQFQKMITVRLFIWETLCIVNILLWSLCNIKNALYIIAVLALFSILLLPTNSNIQRNLFAFKEKYNG